MIYGLISDIHGNLEALTAVLEELEKRKVDEILCLGDVIGYGPDPEECLELVKSRAKVVLAGNHDYASLGLLDVSYFNPYAKRAVDWTASQLSEKARKYLQNRPLKIDFDNFTIVHATPENPAAWEYILSIEDAAENFPYFKGQACFIGHSHVPVIIAQEEDGKVLVRRVKELAFQEHERYIINVGSVGQPRDLDPRAAFGIYDTRENKYQLIRIAYDIQKTQQKILDRGLPAFLAERLSVGQ